MFELDKQLIIRQVIDYILDGLKVVMSYPFVKGPKNVWACFYMCIVIHPRLYDQIVSDFNNTLKQSPFFYCEEWMD